MLVAQSSGRKSSGTERPGPTGLMGGTVFRLARVPSGPTLLGQQFLVFSGNWSHQKSTPLRSTASASDGQVGSTVPAGERPITLPVNRLRYEVLNSSSLQPACWLPPASGFSPQTNASGTANSIVPRRQLSQKWLLRTVLLLPPAIQSPVPTGTGIVDTTSSSSGWLT